MANEEPSSSSNPSDTITVISSDGEEFLLDLELTSQSDTLAKLVSNFDYDRKEVKKEPIPLGNITSSQMKKICLWLEHHRKYPSWVPPTDKHRVPNYSFEEWVGNYLNIPNSELFQLLNAANYLNIPRLFDASCRKVASKIAGKSAEQIRATFNIKADAKVVAGALPSEGESSPSSDESESRVDSESPTAQEA